MSDHLTDKPTTREGLATYIKRLEAEGQREIYIRKAIMAHFDLKIDAAIAACSGLSSARHRELSELRARFPDLNENRFAWKISKSLTISKEDALIWAQTILLAEG